MNERQLAEVRASIERVDRLHAQRIAEFERRVAGLQELLRDLATSALQLLETSPPRDPADAVVVGDIVKRARKALAHLQRRGS